MTEDDECWLFTCECCEPACAGIGSGLFVVHAEGLVIWRWPDRPGQVLAVFQERAYQAAVFSCLEALLEDPPRGSGLHWATGISPERLYQRMGVAKAKVFVYAEGDRVLEQRVLPNESGKVKKVGAG